MMHVYEDLELTANDIVAEQVSIWLRRRRLEQAQLADLMGVSSATLSRKINGHIGWSVTDLVNVASCLDVPITALLPNDAVEMTKASRSRDREASAGIVAGTGFEPATSGL